ncbi:hypothetical protein [Phytoactinopolyspora limicola]|uniref:hypothetical protein n=1 Tax=Phytoactinopolyspora limicola TaxID=2715536 RepID=UPI0014079629|nr:hypothetical protein [Phytoactinopolyspora limicola]
MTSSLHHAVRRTSERVTITALSAALLGAALAFAPANPPVAAAQPEPGDRVTDLGVAMYAPNVRLSDIGELADGTPVGYLFSDGEPVSFNVVDLRTGELLDTHEMAPYSVASSIDVADNGTVYLSVRSPNDGTLWRYTPDSQELTQIATRISGEGMLRTLDIDGDTLYGTTYPNATVYAMDLASEEIVSFGSIAPGSDYAWGLEANDGELWAGTGTPAQLFSLDPDTGSVTPIELPAGVAEHGGFIQRIETYDDIKVVSHRAVDGATAHVHDGTGWVDQLAISGIWLYTEQMADGAFYYLGFDGLPRAYDVATGESTPVEIADPVVTDAIADTTRLFLAELGTDEFPGHTLLGVRADGRVWRYNLATGHGDVMFSQTHGAPVTTISIGQGGDGDVYVGAYLSPGVMARVDVETGEIEQLDGPEQADAITAHGTFTVVSTYPEAKFYAAEHSQPWEWGTNPRHLFTLGRAQTGQDRPRHMISAGDLVAAGTIPNYGELGGALTLFDPATGEYEFHRDVVPDQSVTDLAYNDGVVYGGTTIHGGLDSTPTQDTAELFAWDIDEGLMYSTPIIDDAEIISSLAFDTTGGLWGMANTGALFHYDTDAEQLVQTIDTGFQHSNQWGTGADLHLNPADGHLYGAAGGRLIRVDTEDASVEVLVSSGVARSTVANGDVYFTDTTNVFHYDVATPTIHCDDEITGTHAGPLTVTAGTTCITDATLSGPVRVTGGASLVVSGSTIDGPVRADGADDVVVRDSSVNGPVSVNNTSGTFVLSGNEIFGPLACAGNAEKPDDEGRPNSLHGPVSGQCTVIAG